MLSYSGQQHRVPNNGELAMLSRPCATMSAGLAGQAGLASVAPRSLEGVMNWTLAYMLHRSLVEGTLPCTAVTLHCIDSAGSDATS